MNVGDILLKQPIPLVSKIGGAEMAIANVYTGGFHYRLRVSAADLEELIMRCGWTVVDGLEQVGEEERQELKRLDSIGSVQSNGSGLNWWQERLLTFEPCLTPDL